MDLDSLGFEEYFLKLSKNVFEIAYGVGGCVLFYDKFTN